MRNPYGEHGISRKVERNLTTKRGKHHFTLQEKGGQTSIANLGRIIVLCKKIQQAKKVNDEINFGCTWEAIDYKLPVKIAIVNPIY